MLALFKVHSIREIEKILCFYGVTKNLESLRELKKLRKHLPVACVLPNFPLLLYNSIIRILFYSYSRYFTSRVWHFSAN